MEEEKEFSQLNVIPLVDIMLVLLTIVLVTATFIVEGSIPVKLPKSKSASTKPIKSYKLVITKSGSVFFEGRALSFDELRQVIKSISKQSPVAIYADKGARVEALVKVLDILKTQGLKRVFIRTQVER